jgi:hypothetical protein
LKTFKVYSSQLVYHVLEVKADTEEQAEEIAFNESDAWQVFDYGNWQIENIEEVKQ